LRLNTCRSLPISLHCQNPPIERNPPPADDSAEAAPRRKRKPVGWSMIFIGVLVRGQRHAGPIAATASTGVPQNSHPRFSRCSANPAAPCWPAACSARSLRKISATRKNVSRSLGPNSGLKGLLIGTAFGAILPGGAVHRLSGGCSTADGRLPILRRHHRHGRKLDADRLMAARSAWGVCRSWATDFTLWRIVISLADPRFWPARSGASSMRGLYPKGEPS